MKWKLTGATRLVAVVLAVLFAAACSDTEPTAPAAPSAEDATALFSNHPTDEHWVHPDRPTDAPDGTCKNPDFNTISDAVSAATDHDLIVVCQGDYNERVVINKDNLTIRSEDPTDSDVVQNTRVTAGEGDDVFQSRAAALTIDGFTIHNAGRFGVYFRNASANSAVRNSRILDSRSRGISVSAGANSTFENLLIRGSGSDGIIVATPGNTFDNVEAIDNGRDGIRFSGGGNENLVVSSRLCGNADDDLRFRGGDFNTVQDNQFDTVRNDEGNNTFEGNMPCGPLWVDVDGFAGPDDCAGTDAAFTDIQDAVEWFVGTPFEGGTINVCAGTYLENVQVRNDAGHPNNLTIQAVEEATVELGPETNHVFFIRNRTGVVVKGFTIAGSTSPAQHAVRLRAGSDNTITENTVTSGGIGSTHGSTDIAVTHNAFENPGRTAISAGTGWIVRHNVVEQASFHPTNPAAISIGGSGADVAHNEVSNGGSTGIRIGGAGGHEVLHNTVVESATGIDVVSDGNGLNQNIAEDNDRDGIRIDGDDNELRNSRACGNGNAEFVDIFVVGGANNVVLNSNYDTAFDDGDDTTWRNNRNCAGDRWTGPGASPDSSSE